MSAVIAFHNHLPLVTSDVSLICHQLIHRLAINWTPFVMYSINHTIINSFKGKHYSIFASKSKQTIAKNDRQLVRKLFGFPFKPFKGQTNTSKLKKYSERRILGYSKDQLFEVVSRVDDYHLFVPACVKSRVIERHNTSLTAELEIGIPPLIWERYTSRVVLQRPHLVSAKCIDGKLFRYLETNWRFGDGLAHNPQTCSLDFNVSFEFRSLIHSQLVHIFFDEMVHKTVNAFLKRAEQLYGKQTLPTISTRLSHKT